MNGGKRHDQTTWDFTWMLSLESRKVCLDNSILKPENDYMQRLSTPRE